MTADLERHLQELGVIARPAQPPRPAPARPQEPPHKSAGIWYPDGNVPF